MDAASASWLVIALSVAAANLPFFTERVLGMFPLKPAADGSARSKSLWARLLELVVLYFVVGAVARLLEVQVTSVAPQTWEFYAITAPLFLVLAFPGFVLRYLRKRH